MTHTAHPYGERIGIIRGWRSSWFSGSRATYCQFLREDHIIRNFLQKNFEGKSVHSIHVSRDNTGLVITIHTSKPGFVIGRNGEGIDLGVAALKAHMKKNGIDNTINIQIKVEEIRFSETSAEITAESIIESLQKRMPFRRVLKQTAERVIASREVDGVKISLSGRLGGAEIARREWVRKGRIPLQTMSADIDYACKPAVLPYGTIGVKVWIYKGNVKDEQNK